MSKGGKDSSAMGAAAAMRTIQGDAYLAIIEWPVVLVSRLKEVEEHLAVTSQEPSEAAKSRSEPPVDQVGPALIPTLGAQTRPAGAVEHSKGLPRGPGPGSARSGGRDSVISRRKNPAGSGKAAASAGVPVVEQPGVSLTPSPGPAAEEDDAFNLFDNLDVERSDGR